MSQLNIALTIYLISALLLIAMTVINLKSLTAEIEQGINAKENSSTSLVLVVTIVFALVPFLNTYLAGGAVLRKFNVV